MAGSAGELPVKCSINDKILKELLRVSNLAFLSFTISAEVSVPLTEKGNGFLLLSSFFFHFFYHQLQPRGQL